MTNIYWTRECAPPIDWWTIQNGELRIKVTNQHRLYRASKQWCMECRTLGISVHVLEAGDLESAKIEALEEAKKRLTYLQLCWADIDD